MTKNTMIKIEIEPALDIEEVRLSYHLPLYSNLINLVENNESFFYQDFQLGEGLYRVFNYRLASYTDFLQPGAIECRGVTFEIDSEGNMLELVSLPFHKFFNLYENPLTANLDLDDVESIDVKADGSLISTFWSKGPNGNLCLKSKGSLFSDQAKQAQEWLEKPENSEFYDWVESYEVHGYTVIMEWVSLENRIVLGYDKPRLIILGVRDRYSGKYIPTEELRKNLGEYMEPKVNLNGLSPSEFILAVPSMLDDVEGFVVRLKSGLWFKVKTNKYLSLHRCKDSVNNPRRLFEVIVDEGIDDIRSMFHTDQLLIKQIDDMQSKVDHIFNHMIKVVEDFYNDNKNLERKNFAIKAKSEVEPMYFSLTMMKFLGKTIDYKSFAKKNWNMFGIADSEKQ
ncbi:MAG: T4 RnlA family RNA ligase [Nitrososphaeraceae archaeon]